MSEIVAYFRVSTKAQGMHGLGMAAQRASVLAYAEKAGLAIVVSYSEVETARLDHLKNRPELVRALAHARRARAVLVIARLDRLARSVFVTSQLLNSGVEFVAFDNPHANRMSIQILAVMAEHGSRMTSLRVKASIAERRARGEVFRSTHQLSPDARRLGQLAAAIANRERTRVAYEDLVPFVKVQRSLSETLRSIASSLNERGHRTQVNRAWTIAAVHRFLRREGLGHAKSLPRKRPPLRKDVQRLGTIAAADLRTRRTSAFYAQMMHIVRELHRSEISSGAIARHLNEAGLTTQAGRPWTVMNTIALLRRDGLIGPPVRQSARGGFSPHVQNLGVAAAALVRRRQAQKIASKFMPLVRQLETLHASPKAIANSLNSCGYATRGGLLWTGSKVRALVARENMTRDLLSECDGCPSI